VPALLTSPKEKYITFYFIFLISEGRVTTFHARVKGARGLYLLVLLLVLLLHIVVVWISIWN